MDSQTVVLEISSDEEDVGFSEKDESSPDWISELFDHTDETTWDPDIVVVDELSCAPVPPKQYSETLGKLKDVDKIGGYHDDDGDDDCMILDGDPDKPVDIVHNKRDESDDLLVVAEKGQLACRDYPHSRHLCATFPFSTTPHAKYCDQCHCYVCDSLAPCVYWGTGSSSADHCHSTDKEERWKLQRKSFKESISATNQVKVLDGSCSLAPPLKSGHSPIPVHLDNNPVSQRPLSNTLRACSVSGNAISQGHQLTPALYYRQRVVIRSHPLAAASVNVQSERQPSLPPRVYPGFPNFKRSGFARTALTGSHIHRPRVGFTQYSQVHRQTPPQNSRHQPVTVPHRVRCPPVFIPRKNNQIPPVIPQKSLQDLLAGLESDLGLSDNGIVADLHPVAVSPQSMSPNQSSGWSTSAHIQNAERAENPMSFCNSADSASSQSYIVPSQPVLHGSSCLQTPPSSDPNVVGSSAQTDPSFLKLNSSSFNNAPQMAAESQSPALDPIGLPVANNNVSSLAAPVGDWMSIFTAASTEIPKAPDIPPGLSSVEPLGLFDFEDPWNCL